MKSVVLLLDMLMSPLNKNFVDCKCKLRVGGREMLRVHSVFRKKDEMARRRIVTPWFFVLEAKFIVDY